MKRLIRWLFYQHRANPVQKGSRRAGSIFHDVLVFCLIFLVAILLCSGLSRVYDDNNNFAVSIFILAVALIARFTQGYLYGIAASLVGVFSVNYMFTFPYWEFDMTLSGYPLTFASMLAVSICVSTLTTRLMRADQLRMEAEMEKMRANLLRSVSHDLRTPLTSIVGSTSVLMENSALSHDQQNELIREINKDARWLARITENILSVTKFSGSQVRLHKEYEVVEEIVSSAIVKFRKNHESVQIQVHRPEEFLMAPMDATLIEQVLLNLMDNAMDHGVHTTAISITIFGDDRHVTISVSDNGDGIREQVFPHLFDGLASSSGGRPDNQRNMGIGLSVCQSIMRAHGGGIRAYNKQDGGACFEIQLPAGEDEAHE